MNLLSPFASQLGLVCRTSKCVTMMGHRLFSTAGDKTKKPFYPRAAVAATIQWTCPRKKVHHYLLVRRKNPPDKNKWSLPGGKIELGEEAVAAAKREIFEETQIWNCHWYPDTFLTTDAIVVNNNQQNGEGDKTSEQYSFHYVIAHCFAWVPACMSKSKPALIASDDALNARWWTLKELQNLDCSANTIKVIQRAETLSRLGLLAM